MPDDTILRVAVTAPVPGLFDYLPPADGSTTPLVRGLRLRVPFGGGTRIGFLWEVVQVSERAPALLKPALALLDSEPLLSAAELALLAWAADYYQHPLGEVLALALPVRLRRGEALRPPRLDGWRLTHAGQTATTAPRAHRQTRLMELLRAHPDGLSRKQLQTTLDDPGPLLLRLARQSWIERCEVPIQQTPQLGPPLHADQASAVAAVVAALGGFRAFLLEGVTGSGKTEVYLHLIERVLACGGQILILVPEIGLTPQLQRRLTRRLSARVALLHSGLAEGKREADWFAARAGTAAVVLGTRSAVFTPLPRLALILVDEEHDLSFKQQEGLRYSARDLAVWRARQCGCPVVLGSATPSLETLRNAAAGRYTRLPLPLRAGGASSPRLDLIDLRSVHLQAGLSPALIRLLRENLAAGQQSLLFLNRRGYAPRLTCHACGWVGGCPQCDARLTLHQGERLLWCHHCGHRQPQPERCPACGRIELRALGQGTERLEQALTELFGEVPLARIDRDSTRRRGSLERLLEEARTGHYPLLLGTQMLAKGHHFPEVTLVGILDLDQGLYGADYRASERMAQLVIQVAGRAGRAHKPGRVVLQTRHPEHPLLQTLIHQGYGAFAALALEERQLAQLPPFSAQALLRAEAPAAVAPQVFLEAALAAAGELPPGLQLWGPVPAPMERRADRYRAHLLVQADARSTLQVFLGGWVAALYRLPAGRRIRWSLDVDPQEMV